MLSTVLYRAWTSMEIIMGRAMFTSNFPTGIVPILLSFMGSILVSPFSLLTHTKGPLHIRSGPPWKPSPYRYFFIPSEAVSGSAEMVMVISMLFSLANFATQSTKASLAAWS